MSLSVLFFFLITLNQDQGHLDLNENVEISSFYCHIMVEVEPNALINIRMHANVSLLIVTSPDYRNVTFK